MSKQRMINTKIWEDAWFNELDPIEKLFFVYLLTNPMTNIIGCYELSRGTIGRATGLEIKVVDEILSRFETAKKVYYRNGWVVLVNFVKHQNYRSPKIQAGLRAELENIPENISKLLNLGKFVYGIDTLSHSNSNSNSNSKSYGVKNADSQITINNMPISDLNYDDVTYEDFEEQTPKKYRNKSKLYARLGIYYMTLLNKTGNVLRYYPILKEILSLAEKDNPNDNEEQIEKEIKARIDIANWYYLKNNCKGWGLGKVAENWNIIFTEWNKEKKKHQ